MYLCMFFFFFQAEDGIRDYKVTGVQTCALPISPVRAEYEDGLEPRLRDLHERVHRGSYRAQPSRRIYLQKPDGRQRPIGIAALEDKIVQQAVVTILNAIYEEDFRGFSYGFRPGRGPHNALDALSVGIVGKQVNGIVDADIRGFLDRVSYCPLVIEKVVAADRLL